MADEPIKFPSARQPVWATDQQGFPVFTRPWFLFLQNLWLRSGGSSAPDMEDILGDYLQSPGVFEHPLQRDVFEQLLGEVSQLRSEVAEVVREVAAARLEFRAELAELAKEMNGLRQGSLS